MTDTRLYYKYWGKAKPEAEGGPAYHLLPYHCLDVAAVAFWHCRLKQRLVGRNVRTIIRPLVIQPSLSS
jgi:hypothetical protein